MSHYYTKNNDIKSNPQDIYFKILDKNFHFQTDNGVFSKSGLDFGSRLLIESVIEINKDKVLDLGCGYGPIGIVYKTYNKNSHVTMLDINDRATLLTEKNAKINNVIVDIVNNDGFKDINQKFDLIITNPPVRTGKKNIYQMFHDSYDALNDEGMLIFVLNKKQGAMSAIEFCTEIYKKVTVINKKSGFLIIQCIK